MKTRYIKLGFVINEGLDYLKEQLRLTSRKAGVSVYVHETPESGTPRVDVVVDVWGENEGSVDDYCDFYLQQFAGRAYDFSLLNEAFVKYSQRLCAWYAAEKS
jgi:hypothetical protein